MNNKIKSGFSVKMESNFVKVYEVGIKIPHATQLPATPNVLLFEEIKELCVEKLKKFYIAEKIEKDILPLIVNEYVVGNYVHEADCYRVGNDGTIFYNKGFLTTENNFIIALPSHYIFALDQTKAAEIIKEKLDKLNECFSELPIHEAKHMYEKSIEQFKRIQTIRAEALVESITQYVSFVELKNQYKMVTEDVLSEITALIEHTAKNTITANS